LHDLLDELGDAAYREFSGPTHATLSGLMNEVEHDDDESSDVGAVIVTPRTILVVAATAFMAFLAGFERLLDQYGWAPEFTAGWKLHCIRQLRPLLTEYT
jgi:hypothetical protein